MAVMCRYDNDKELLFGLRDSAPSVDNPYDSSTTVYACTFRYMHVWYCTALEGTCFLPCFYLQCTQRTVRKVVRFSENDTPQLSPHTACSFIDLLVLLENSTSSRSVLFSTCTKRPITRPKRCCSSHTSVVEHLYYNPTTSDKYSRIRKFLVPWLVPIPSLAIADVL
ncbi:hypothetical protein L873DRAFT_788699 [Choiromyces venosus 120613-1]|uniref:Uncharacterized protein n=1 Tax=Choiromyces venosus 120613-1 TaxID=1336337 RepID=A0A3N4K479_9PEZI|nr:hypothetical protein L873DRAFT_788699 [Choiromyces venosus 120613-1]